MHTFFGRTERDCFMSDGGFYEREIEGTDGHRIRILCWTPVQQDVSAVVHICHGMAEHGGRYEELGHVLAQAGLATVVHHQRGHDPELGPREQGHFSDHDGWSLVLEDAARVQHWVRENWPNSSSFLLGHSMGSFVAQDALMRGMMPAIPDGLILSASNLENPWRLRALRMLVALERRRCGPRGRSPVLKRLTFDAFSASVKNPETPFDWLSSDHQAVRDYIADPACGFECTTQFWEDLSSGIQHLIRPDSQRAIPHNLPIFILAGNQDPVGNFGRGPTALARAYQRAGHPRVALKLYPGTRHEPFHDLNRLEVFGDVLQWMAEQVDLRPMNHSAAA